MEIRRGDIWMVKLEGNRYSVQGGNRPCVIISNDANNKFSPTIQVLPITSQSKNNLPVHVLLNKEIGLMVDSTVLLEQITTVGKPSLLNYVCRCEPHHLRQIEKALMIQAGIITPQIDISYINNIISKINGVDRLIAKCVVKGLNYENELLDRSFLLGELIAYCKQHHIDYRQILARKGLMKPTYVEEKLRRVL